MKKLISFLLAMLLCVAMACPAFAADDADTEGAVSAFTQSTEVPPPVDPDVPVDPDLPVPETGDRSPQSTILLAGIMGLSFVGILVVGAILWKNREGSEA